MTWFPRKLSSDGTRWHRPAAPGEAAAVGQPPISLIFPGEAVRECRGRGGPPWPPQAQSSGEAGPSPLARLLLGPAPAQCGPRGGPGSPPAATWTTSGDRAGPREIPQGLSVASKLKLRFTFNSLSCAKGDGPLQEPCLSCVTPSRPRWLRVCTCPLAVRGPLGALGWAGPGRTCPRRWASPSLSCSSWRQPSLPAQ